MNRTLIAIALVALSFSASAAPKAELKSYTLTNKAEACKKGYQRMEVEFMKVAANGSVSFKYKGDKVMGPVPKQYAAQFLKMKVGDVDCIPGSQD